MSIPSYLAPTSRPEAPAGVGSPRESAVAEQLLRRGLAAVGLLGIALIHLLDVQGKFAETPYLGVGYVLLIASALGVAELLVRRESPMLWLATGALAASALLGYVVSRTTGLPDATGDIGNWLEPLGLASLFAEGVVVLLAAAALLRDRDR